MINLPALSVLIDILADENNLKNTRIFRPLEGNPKLQRELFASAIREKLDDLNVFVMSMKPQAGVSIHGLGGSDQTIGDGRLDLPFEICGFEHIDSESSIFSLKSEQANKTVDIFAVIIREISPNNYICAHLAQHGTTKDAHEPIMLFYAGEKAPAEGNKILSHFLSLVHSSKIGSEKVNLKFRIGHGENRRPYRIRKIIHCIPRDQMNSESITKRNIDFSHRWEVMGHWRKIDGLGKNRGGEYTTQGYTWVIPHVRGPEDKMLVKKTRVIHAEKNIE